MQVMLLQGFVSNRELRRTSDKVVLFIEGNDKLLQITSQEPQQLRVDQSDFSGLSRFAKYSSFGVGDAAGKYRVSVGGYSGNAGRWKCTSYVSVNLVSNWNAL